MKFDWGYIIRKTARTALETRGGEGEGILEMPGGAVAISEPIT
jgi:hypothetical protein